MESLKLSYRMNINGQQEYFFCHAGVDPEKPLEEQTEKELLWIREAFFNYYSGDATIISGHTPLMLIKSEDEMKHGKNISIWRDYGEVERIKDTKPQWRCNGKVLMMDTGSFMPNGFISAVDLLSGELYQSDK